MGREILKLEFPSGYDFDRYVIFCNTSDQLITSSIFDGYKTAEAYLKLWNDDNINLSKLDKKGIIFAEDILPFLLEEV